MTNRQRKELRNTGVYTSYKNGEKFHVRLQPLETPRFPHGLSLSPAFDTEDEAYKFALEVEEYYDKCFKSFQPFA